jgi:hypothetical protein
MRMLSALLPRLARFLTIVGKVSRRASAFVLRTAMRVLATFFPGLTGFLTVVRKITRAATLTSALIFAGHDQLSTAENTGNLTGNRTMHLREFSLCRRFPLPCVSAIRCHRAVGVAVGPLAPLQEELASRPDLCEAVARTART